jgi:hypothetical protein
VPTHQTPRAAKPERKADPNSPFAALGDLKRQLEEAQRNEKKAR